jgi:peptidyl-prolyl cis-trans isomerase D
MALIGKIRNNSWILIVMIAVGMGGFILQDVVTNQGQRQSGNFELANINGKSIDYREFQSTENVLYAGASNQDGYAQKASLWQYFMDKAIVESEAEELGIGVSYDELLELQFGQKLSPIIAARFKNQVGQIDRERLNSFRDAIEANDLDPRFREYWAVQEKEIIKDKQQTKLQNLFGKAVYTPQWMAEEFSKEAGSNAQFEYVKIPFEKIGDDQIELTDDAIASYIKKNEKKYRNTEESRFLKFIEFRVLPTSTDSVLVKNHVSKLMGEFKTASNDSLYVINNSGNYTFMYYKSEDLPLQIQDELVNMNSGDVYGPYFDVNKYTIAKLVDKKIVADSVKARHILRAVNGQDPNSYTSAQKLIDSLKTVLEDGTASFDSLATKFSNDPGSAIQGGDLGYFAQGSMVQPFNYACFHGKEGVYHVVNTQFGVHLIQVTDRKYNDQDPKYKVAYISNTIVPSQETQDSIYEIATELVTSSTNVEELTANLADHPDLEIKESAPLKQNDYIFGSFGSAPASRDLIRWAYEGGVEAGDISSVIYTYTDKVNYYNSNYLIVALDKINPKGIKSVEEARASVELLVSNKLKGAKIIEQLTNTDLNAVAAQFELKVDTVQNVGFNSNFIPGLGNEPSVLFAVFNGTANTVAAPIVGNSGVYVIKPVAVNISEQASNDFIQQKSATEGKTRNEVGFKFIDALRKNADMEDNRYLFY